MELTEEIAAYHDGTGEPGRLVGEFRRSVLLAPLEQGPAGA